MDTSTTVGLLEACRQWLLAHADYVLAQAVEPPSDDMDNPLDPSEWMEWYDTQAKPTAETLDSWRLRIAAELDVVPGRVPTHPFILEPFCKHTLGMALTAEQQRWLDANPVPKDGGL